MPSQAFPVFGQRAVIDVVWIALLRQHHGGRVDKPADVIDMAVGVVAHHAAAQPEHVGDAETAP